MFVLRTRQQQKNFSIKALAGFLFFLFFLSGCALLVSRENSFYIDLNEYPVYIRAGFEPPERGAGINFSDTGWKVISSLDRKMPLKIKNLGLPDTPKRKFFSPFGEKAREYTLAIPFNVNAERYQELRENTIFQPGVFFASLGDNWAIYLNGELVRSELHLDEDGEVLSHRTRRHIYFPLDKALFFPGTNLLAIRIVGSPDYEGTGMFNAGFCYMEDYQSIIKRHNQAFQTALSGIYIFVGFYYLLLFLSRSKERYNFFFCLFSALLGFYFLFRGNAICRLIPNSDILMRLEYACIFMVIPMLISFLDNLSFGKTAVITRIYRNFCLLLTAALVPFSHQFTDDILFVWQRTSLFPAAYILVHNIIYGFFILTYKDWKKSWQEGQTDSLLKAYGRAFAGTSLGNILIGLFALIITTSFDLVATIVRYYGVINASWYGFFLFPMIIILVLARRFTNLFYRLDHMNTVLEATVRKRTQELEHQTQLAESASQAKSAFLARMSHEIRTPLNAILGLSEVELQDELASKTRINLEKIYSSGSNLLEIINDILDLSKIEAGNFEILPVEYEFLSVINDTVQLNIVRIGTKPVKFILDLDEDIPSRLYGDELRLKQILNNLLSNAIKYTQQGEVRLEIRWERRSDGAWFAFTVKDTGKGIKREDIGKLFTEYTQLDVKANRRIEGTGLGLSITKGLVEMMGGMITAESEYQKGSTFQVRLPQGLVDDKPIGKEVVENLKNFRLYESRSRIRRGVLTRSYMPYGRVLVVDDVPTNLDVIKGLMMPYGLKVDTVSGGREAVELIRAGTEKYDLVFMDHMMPEMDGIEAVKIIREELGTEYARTVPIVVLTANAITGNRELFLENGFNDFISKPIDIKQLDMALNRWVRDKQSAETLKEAERQARKQVKIQGKKNGPGEGGADEAGVSWLLNSFIEGIDFTTALALYGNSGSAFIPVLKSFVTHIPPLLEGMEDLAEKNLTEYTIKVHGLKGSCAAIGAGGAAAMALELEMASREGNLEFVKARHGALKKTVLALLEDIKNLFKEWDANFGVAAAVKEEKSSPERELILRLYEASAEYKAGEIEKILKELEQYRYKSGEELILWLREQADNIEYEEIHKRLEAYLAGDKG